MSCSLEVNVELVGVGDAVLLPQLRSSYLVPLQTNKNKRGAKRCTQNTTPPMKHIKFQTYSNDGN
jgi:hypothetical protein